MNVVMKIQLKRKQRCHGCLCRGRLHGPRQQCDAQKLQKVTIIDWKLNVGPTETRKTWLFFFHESVKDNMPQQDVQSDICT